MNSKVAIKFMLPNLRDDDIAIFTNGYISRYAFGIRDRNANFYMIGSMGLVSSVGLGMALNMSERVFIFDGDGSILMDLGTMAMIANHKAQNLFHIVLDNESYESTGAQPAISENIDISSLAKAAGYRCVLKINNLGELRRRFRDLINEKGPVFLHVKVCGSGYTKAGRVAIDPQDLSARITEKIRQG